MKTILVLAFLLSSAAALAAERVPIEPAAYSDSRAASEAWRPLEGSAAASLASVRTPDGRPALAFACDMTRVRDRAYWDHDVTLDLSRAGRVTFWIEVRGDVAAISGMTLYFRSGAGWYGAPFGPQDDGWSRITLDRGAFKPEDTPGGWGAIQGIRLAFWKGAPRQATVHIGGMEAESADVAVVRNTRAGPEDGGWAERMAAMLDRAGIDAATVDDVDVENGGLAGKRFAVYPQNPRISDHEMDAVEAYVRQGGRLLVCFALPPRLASLLGVEDLGYLRPERPGQFSVMRFAPGGPAGTPREARQASWNIERVRPAGKGARVLAEWYDAQGKDAGSPAVVLSDTGAYVSHVLLDDDPANKERLLRAVVGHFVPAIWREVAGNAVARSGQVSGREEGFAQAVARVRSTAEAGGRSAAVAPYLRQADLAHGAASRALKAERWTEALDAAGRTHGALLAAWVRAQPTKAHEFRAVWCHNAYGVAGMTWDQAVRRLKQSGFTAIVPNMLWGGVADYASDVLPLRDRVAKEGDQIALCLAACRKYGVQMHVWKVDWNLAGAPEAFVERMRREQRLQFDAAGKEEPWLCPSHPANTALERDALLEVVRKYAVDGIHFDYIRYPDSAHCYCDGCRQRFETQTAKPVAAWPGDVLRDGPRYAEYQEFRRANITRLVKTVSDEARRIRPGVKVSAAVFSNWPQCREDVGQDWGAWVQAGYLDFVCPMDYTASDRGFRGMVRVQREAVAAKIPLYPGIGASAPGLPLGQVVAQIGIARDEGAPGFILFNYDGAVAAEYVPALAAGPTRPAAPPLPRPR